MRHGIFTLACCLVLAACNSIKTIKTAFIEEPPYAQYVRSLEKANLTTTAMAVAWLNAGEHAFFDSVTVTLPFSESGFFPASEPTARSYRFAMKEGQVLTIDASVVAKENSRFFMDLFVWKDNEWKHLAYADSALQITHEFKTDEMCLLRTQPELLVNAYYAVSLSATPVLINPVKGASNKSIGSFYGAPRDGGKRSHEGVDIFAKKGTPVVAPTDGIVTRVGNNTLGGKVVWMQDRKRGHSYYFAHLDSQMVKPGLHVKQGDILGTVGNTGNARFTPPHLHFGIYQARSKDPLYYIRMMEDVLETMPVDTAFQHQAFKVAPKKTVLHEGPVNQSSSRATLVRDTYVKVIAQSKDWYRVSLPDHRQGYLLKKDLKPIDKGKPVKVPEPTVLLSEVTQGAVPLKYLDAKHPVEILAGFENYQYVRTGDGVLGWLAM